MKVAHTTHMITWLSNVHKCTDARAAWSAAIQVACRELEIVTNARVHQLVHSSNNPLRVSKAGSYRKL
uniref:Uncharacterized protein n=1 Tax=Arundo donax TaxID=35708 RepID=A0A0A9DX62_ARUDO